ncbi:MAG: hypothetical protein ACRDXX_03505 [Stackebrandtia sp.]
MGLGGARVFQAEHGKAEAGRVRQRRVGSSVGTSRRPGDDRPWLTAFGPLRGPGALLTWLLLFFPAWWLLGLGGLIFPMFAALMAVSLARRRSIEVPPAFGVWLAFCAVMLVSLAALGADPPGTVAGSLLGHVPGAGYRVVGYFSVTVILLYAVNLSEREFSRRRLINLLAWLGVITVGGGIFGVVAGYWETTSLVEALLPNKVAADGFVQSLVHPQASQVMDFLGYETPRPAAPWGYTNTWGNMLAICGPWLAVAAFCVSERTNGRGKTRPSVRLAAAAILAIALIPTVYSMNRGLWLNLAVAGVFIAARLFLAGRVWPVGVLGLVGVLATAAVLVTPLGQVVAARLDNPHSDDGRAYSSVQAVETTMRHSPVLGFGSTRKTVGSGSSIAVGPTDDCPRCGGRTLGGNGQLWQVLFAHGFAGAFLYVGFFCRVLWRFRRDHSAVGIVGSVVMLLSLTSMFYYNALLAPLAATMLCYALLWRNERDHAVEGMA